MVTLKKAYLARGITLAVLCILVTTLIFPSAKAPTPIRGRQVLGLGTAVWDKGGVFTPFVIYDGASFTMWYSGETEKGFDTICMATSNDGVSWSRYAKNILLRGVAGSWDSGSVIEPWVIHQGTGYKMWYTGEVLDSNGDPVKNEIGYATSPDGIQWTKYSGNPVLTLGSRGSWDESFVSRPIVISSGLSYTMYYIGENQTENFQIGMATSSDGIHWTKSGPIQYPDSDTGWDSTDNDIDLGSIQRLPNIYLMAYSGAIDEGSPHQIGLASSNDGINWTPYLNNPVIINGTRGDWDASLFDANIVKVGDNYYVYYSGSNLLSGDDEEYTIGLAILPISQFNVSGLTSTYPILAGAMLLPSPLLSHRRMPC